ncbi:MAG: ABC transporter permease, partial [Parasporobacterium sp.]|nr:ABC transporter permease [Parasporobacterium sp.]
QLWHYATPVAYGLTLIPQKYTWIYLLNPITPVITTIRYAFFGIGYFNLTYYLISLGITLIVLFIGLILFNKIERTFMDTV